MRVRERLKLKEHQRKRRRVGFVLSECGKLSELKVTSSSSTFAVLSFVFLGGATCQLNVHVSTGPGVNSADPGVGVFIGGAATLGGFGGVVSSGGGGDCRIGGGGGGGKDVLLE
ncbi:hypothetical protein AAZX31_18G084700 [Glycine max]